MTQSNTMAARLAELETKAKEHGRAFDQCLATIQREQLYRAANYGNFSQYVAAEWGKERTWAYRNIWLYEVRDLLPGGNTINEGQARYLKKLRDEGCTWEAVREVWARAVEQHGPKVTRVQVKALVNDYLYTNLESPAYPGSGTQNVTEEETEKYWSKPPRKPTAPPKNQDVAFMFTQEEFKHFNASVKVLREAWKGSGIEGNREIVLHAVMAQANAVRGKTELALATAPTEKQELGRVA